LRSSISVRRKSGGKVFANPRNAGGWDRSDRLDPLDYSVAPLCGFFNLGLGAKRVKRQRIRKHGVLEAIAEWGFPLPPLKVCGDEEAMIAAYRAPLEL